MSEPHFVGPELFTLEVRKPFPPCELIGYLSTYFTRREIEKRVQMVTTCDPHTGRVESFELIIDNFIDGKGHKYLAAYVAQFGAEPLLDRVNGFRRAK
jgi:hypothetical protein